MVAGVNQQTEHDDKLDFNVLLEKMNSNIGIHQKNIPQYNKIIHQSIHPMPLTLIGTLIIK